ncbi:MAG: ABC transporter permease subunit [Holosporales bacterium]|jgi:putrescine transport system permease protein|nr:ABC transporter permease subunit [Holosporales bacterium]
MRKVSKTTLSFLLLGYAFLYLPLFFVILNSFNDTEVPGIWKGFSFQVFLSVLEDKDLLYAALNSFKIALISATGAVFLGLLAAISTATKSSFWGKSLLDRGTIIPIFIPDIIIGFSLLMLFVFMKSAFGFPKGRGCIIVSIGHILASVAYVCVTIRAKLLMFDKSIEDAAKALGAKSLTIFLQIKIPIIKESILTGWLLAFTLSLDDLVIASFLASPGNVTLPMRIFSYARFGIDPKINAFATMLMTIVFICLTLAYFISRRKK